MGRLLDARDEQPKLEVSGQLQDFAPELGAEAGARIAFQERNSPQLVQQLLGCLDAGAIPVLAHPRWPRPLREEALERAGAGRPWTGESIATLLFTSGSTATPKVVAHTLEAHLACAHASGMRVPFQRGDRWLLSLPLCHVGGLSLLFRAVVGGGTLVLPDPDERLAEALVRTRPSHLSLVATQLRELLDREDTREALAGCRQVLLGGGPCPTAWLEQARELGCPVRLTYGLTEMASQVATETDGRLTPLHSAKLRVDAQRQIWVCGDALFSGYLVDDQLESPLQDGWFATGDLGRPGPTGALEIFGRLDNQFISGGENVQPESIEAAFHARGIEIVVVGIPDEKFGTRPVAFSRNGQDHRELALELLPDFSRPVAWLPLPEADGLKPRRAELSSLALRQLRAPD